MECSPPVTAHDLLNGLFNRIHNITTFNVFWTKRIDESPQILQKQNTERFMWLVLIKLIIEPWNVYYTTRAFVCGSISAPCLSSISATLTLSSCAQRCIGVSPFFALQLALAPLLSSRVAMCVLPTGDVRCSAA